MRRRWRRWLAGLLLLGAGGANLLAYAHARAFVRFSTAGERTDDPEALSTIGRLRVLLTGPNVPKPKNRRTPADVGLEFTELRIPVDDAELAVWRVPARGEPRGEVALFHGYAASRDSLLDAARTFHELGYACDLIDFRGSGDSSLSYTTLGVHEARDVRAVVDAIDGRPLVLYGVSMGSAAVLRAIAREGVTADAVILEVPFDRLINAIRNRFDILGVPAVGGAELLLLWGGVHLGFDGFDHNPVDDAAKVTIPTLVLRGAHDRRARPAQVASIHEALAGPKTMVTFPDAAHGPLLADDPALWRDAVDAFLRAP